MPTPTVSSRPAKGSYVRFKDGSGVTRVAGHPKVKGAPEYDLEVGKRGGVLISSADVDAVSEAYWHAWSEGARGGFINIEAHIKAGTFDAVQDGLRYAARLTAKRQRLGLNCQAV